MVLSKKSPRQKRLQQKPEKRRPKREKQKVLEENDIFQEPVKRVICPENQVKLSEQELKNEVSRILTGDDPNVPKNVSKFSYKDRCYKLDPPGLNDHMAVHLADCGCSLHQESDEFRVQQEQEKRKRELDEENMKALQDQSNLLENENSGSSSGNGGSSASHKGNLDMTLAATMDKSKNQFNYSDRATQTINEALCHKFVHTEPPPSAQYSANVSQWQIYDSYVNEATITTMERQESDPLERRRISFGETSSTIIFESESNKEDIIHSEQMGKCLKIVERIVNQNAQDEIYQDFKYWEDASDAYRQGEGSLLPLWRFAFERTKRKEVTALCWNPKNSDLFAVGYGSYDFLRQGQGIICCYSMKNTSFPECSFSTESSVLCLDFHQQHSSLLAVGCYDGNVAVYNVSVDTTKPMFQSSIKTGNHSDPVWQVHWQEEGPGKDLSFYSISGDGRVVSWSLNKNELKMEPVMFLKLFNSIKSNHEDSIISSLTGGCCFDFNKRQPNMFIVGTEDGNIHKCSKAYSGQYLETYEGHHMPVYAVQWNPFNERVFISCSADWMVKIWDHEHNCPLLSFDLGNAVGDVRWSPYSSTIFSAVTNDGKVYQFDLHENKHDPLCEQKVVKRARLTKLKFNSQDYIIIVGDDKGGVNSLKLSPNLRKLHYPTDEDTEVTHMNKIKLQEDKMTHLVTTLVRNLHSDPSTQSDSS